MIIYDEVFENWKKDLKELQENLNINMKHVGEKGHLNPIQYAEKIGEESMLRRIISVISISNGFDIENI